MRFGNFYGGSAYYTHEFSHENELDTVYMGSPNLPLRYEIENVGGTQVGELKEICASVMSEGGLDVNGLSISVSTKLNVRTVSTNTTGALVAIRLNDGYEGRTVYVDNLSIGSNTESNVTYWALYFNPSGSDAFQWESACTRGSGVLCATNVGNVLVRPMRTGDSGLLGDEQNKSFVIDSGYIVAGTGQGANNFTTHLNVKVSSLLRLGSRINGKKDVIVLAVSPTAATSNYYASLHLVVI